MWYSSLALDLLLLLLLGLLGVLAALAEDGVGVHAVHDVQIPDLNVGLHRSDSDEVSLCRGRRGSCQRGCRATPGRAGCREA